MYIYPLSRIHNTSLVSAYFGQDKREFECQNYYFIIFIYMLIYGGYLRQLFRLSQDLQVYFHRFACTPRS
jgi:hypothetical protein